MKKLLLTGFEPFLNFKINPTMEVVKALDGLQIGEFEVIGRTMVVDFKQSAEQLQQLIASEQPQMIISLGLAGGRSKITPERIAINIRDGEPDNKGYTPQDEVIDDQANDGYFTNLPIRKMVNSLQQAGYPAEISNSAGTYLCNNIMFEGIRYAQRQNSEMLAGFIHIPANFELAISHGRIAGWATRDLITAVQICLEEAVKATQS
ncbi:pyroglutamyl-peptidase I [Kurthia sibirica]|uniref:Pyroglutamyl-peptidase I n=1 Tax=Kurthia sibirica TaxID=202750 RepID=A0A2U3APE1_9BACL|nr:pyroglutamyl-peptidase I [Kurthia sibirica]PWI26394.1 peptidase C15 [Kurthia sibirica]GEK34169.1 pyrrolidone-carboxylate peptidase [Kurthia sibirica]